MNTLPKFLANAIAKVMEHNGYHDGMRTATECESHDRWSPCDLIIREAINNGGGSAKGFLGLTKANCLKCYAYMVDHRQDMIDQDLVSKQGWNNHGIALWQNYNY